MSKNYKDSTITFEDLYSFYDRTKVLDFVNCYPFLPDLLIEAFPVVQKYFPNSEVSLKLFQNQEANDDVYLVLSATSNFDPSETLVRLEQLEEEWGLDAWQESLGKLSVSVDFK